MFHDQSDYNLPPCCSQKYFRHLWQLLHNQPTTTLFILPDYSIHQLLERVLINFPGATVTLALQRPDIDTVRRLSFELTRPWINNTHYVENLNLIIAPPRLKEDPQTRISTLDYHPRNDLLAEFGTNPRTHIYEADIHTTILLIRTKSQSIAFYMDVPQHLNTRSTSLHLFQASTDPHLTDELAKVLKAHMPKRKEITTAPNASPSGI